MKHLLIPLLSLLMGLPAFAATQPKPVEWTVDGTRFAGQLVTPDVAGPVRAGLVLFPNWMGPGDDAVHMAERMAKDGYVVLVADVYGVDTRPTNDAQAMAAVRAAYSDGGVTVRKRATKAVDVLKSLAPGVSLDPTKIGAVGFCFGGGVVLELARSGIDLPGGVVSFHGNLDTHLSASGPIHAPVLVLNGAADSNVSRDQVAAFQAEMTTHGADWQLVDFGGARHCFSQEEDADNPPDSNCRYDARTATRAFRMMRDFFDERFH